MFYTQTALYYLYFTYRRIHPRGTPMAVESHCYECLEVNELMNRTLEQVLDPLQQVEKT